MAAAAAAAGPLRDSTQVEPKSAWGPSELLTGPTCAARRACALFGRLLFMDACQQSQ